MEVILSTRNQNKIDQIKEILADLDNITVLSLDEAGIQGEAVEDGTTLEENALKKAFFASEQSGKWAIADDTGFFIDALNGEPGVRAARWAGEGLKAEDIMNFTLQKLENILPEDRTATFKTVAVVVSPDGQHWPFEGSMQGSILTEPRTACQPNMPYSAIFVPDRQEKVCAEMSVEEENAISNLGKAFLQVRDFFTQNLLR